MAALQNLQRLRDYIATYPDFDMHRYLHCIGGCCSRIMGYAPGTLEFVREWWPRALEFMGIGPELATQLFNRSRWPDHLWKMSDRDGALYLLDGLILQESLAVTPVSPNLRCEVQQSAENFVIDSTPV